MSNNLSTASLRKPYRPVRDTVKIIRPNAFKEQLTDTSDIVVKKKLAPRTKKAMNHLIFENMENYFTLPGRRMYSRPMQKLFERQVDAKRKEGKPEEDVRSKMDELEPLNDDLRTATTKNISTMVHDIDVPKAHNFPKRNLGEARKSYVRKSPIKPSPFPSFSLKSENTCTNSKNNGAGPQTRGKIGAAVPSPINPVPGEPIIIYTKEESADPLAMNENEAEIPQYSTEISLDNAGVTVSETNSVNANVLDMSDLIQTPSNDTQIDGKIEIQSADIVLCDSIEEMNEVIVMGQNGERYRFVALDDGQLTLVLDTTAQ